ncbi:cysteine hydrolase family protein [Aquincola tertiaricarbonis]|uniref:cysteine hydrolase family protein n=1 Tax=Aquincola tertiaricarbonis TaxID=391953 RepID=UPI0006153BBD|nr:isochorismatase family cysteine hydrolase [Aquincola tertiaricarbonis]
MTQPESTHEAADRCPGGLALLITDMISLWDFPDADKLLPAAAAIAPRLAALRRRCHEAGVPVIYANDNRGRWRSDFRELVDKARQAGGPGAHIVEQLAPHTDDYFLLKPKHSAFFATPLELLLADLGIRQIIVTGVSSDQCVLSTVSDARMRNIDALVPQDCIGTQGDERNAAAIRHFSEVLGVDTAASPGLQLRPQPPEPSA